jgi:hypothetical protein
MKCFPLWMLIMIGAVAPALAGHFNVGSPLISGDVDILVKGQEATHRPLSDAQLRTVSSWLNTHREGWKGMITEASREPTLFEIHLTHIDGKQTSISVVSAVKKGGHYLRLTGPDEWAYESLGGWVKSWAATRKLTSVEYDMLLALIDPPQDTAQSAKPEG